MFIFLKVLVILEKNNVVSSFGICEICMYVIDLYCGGVCINLYFFIIICNFYFY